MLTAEVNGREWMAVGLFPSTGELVWVPSDTEILVAPIVDEEAGESLVEREPEVIEGSAEDVVGG